MSKIFGILFLLFTFNISAQKVHKINYTGLLTLSNGTPLAFEMELIEKGGIVNGFSVTGKGTPDETKSDVSGIFNKNTKTYKLKETQVISTSSESDLNTFCYINMAIKEKGKFTLKRFEGTFIGLLTNRDTCAKGGIVLMEKEKLEKIKKKVEKKVDKKIKKRKKIEEEEEEEEEEVKNPVLSTQVLKDGEDMYIQWNSKKLVIYIWDANTEDGDKINLTINGQQILSNFTTKKKRKKVKYRLLEGENRIEITATNTGTTPPNTSRIEIVDSKIKYPILTQLELGKSAIITIVK